MRLGDPSQRHCLGIAPNDVNEIKPQGIDNKWISDADLTPTGFRDRLSSSLKARLIRVDFPRPNEHLSRAL
jgi:hypothetical protein